MFRTFRENVRNHPATLLALIAVWLILPSLSASILSLLLLAMPGGSAFLWDLSYRGDVIRWVYAVELGWHTVLGLVSFLVTCAAVGFFQTQAASPVRRLFARRRRFALCMALAAVAYSSTSLWWWLRATSDFRPSPWPGFLLGLALYLVPIGATIGLTGGPELSSVRRRKWVGLVALLVAATAGQALVSAALSDAVVPQGSSSTTWSEIFGTAYGYAALRMVGEVLFILVIAWFVRPLEAWPDGAGADAYRRPRAA